MINKTLSFEYLYYPGYWLAKGYKSKYAALWKPKNGIKGQDLYCPDEGYGWYVHGGKNESIYLETSRPGYEKYFLIGSKCDDYISNSGRGKSGECIHYNTAHVPDIKDNNGVHESFAFRILCQDCTSKQKCILWRFRDEHKMYTDKDGDLRMCKECGSDDWFNWRVYILNNITSRCPTSQCPNSLKTFNLNLLKMNMSIVLIVVLIYQCNIA